MRRISAIQVAVIGAAVIITVLLSFVHTWPAAGKSAMPPMVNTGGLTLEQLVAESRKGLKPELQNAVAIVEGSVSSERDANKRNQLFDSIIHLLNAGKEYALAAWFSEEKAVKNNGTSHDWEQAGERYRNAVSFQSSEAGVPALYTAARKCFDKALEIDAKNLDAKVGIAICEVETGGDPMKGIGMLLDVVNEDSTNVNAQLALGDFSIKRNAPDKAIIRYLKALQLEPEFYGLHLSLADLYVQVGDTAKAIEHLKMYVQKETDPLVKNQMENEILNLQGNKPKP